jgi:gamma-glutamylcyclotransferase (GGCT)/AIG2-like uncharacterized protein YtfP
MNVFTYGTLMFPEVWRAVTGEMGAHVSGHVAGFAIYRVADAVYPGIVATTTADVVPGVLYFDVDGAAISRLDQFEDDFYRRQMVRVHCDDGRVCEAATYVVPPEKRSVLAHERWSHDEFVARGELQHFLAKFAGFGRLNLSD